MVDQIRINSGVLLGALVSGALAAGTLTGAPTANATCASFWGIGNTADCTSKLFSVAVALGTNAEAHADGLFGSAFSIGNGAVANSHGALDTSLAVGPDTVAEVNGSLGIAVGVGATGGSSYTLAAAGQSSSDFANIALGLGSDSNVFAGGPSPTKLGFGNIGVNLGQGNDVEATGSLNSAINVGGNGSYKNNQLYATGVLNTALNLGGNGNILSTSTAGSPIANLVFNVLGSGNEIVAGPGPLAVAGAIGQTNKVIKKAAPGIHINGIKVPNTATAVGSPKAATPAAAHSRTQKAAPAATATSRGTR